MSPGYMYFPTPEYEKAVKDCTEALRINPKHERSVGRRGTALEKLGRYEEAVRGESFRLPCLFVLGLSRLLQISWPRLFSTVSKIRNSRKQWIAY